MASAATGSADSGEISTTTSLGLSLRTFTQADAAAWPARTTSSHVGSDPVKTGTPLMGSAVNFQRVGGCPRCVDHGLRRVEDFGQKGGRRGLRCRWP